MNKYSIRDHLAQELGKFLSTFKATSFDDANNEYLCSDEVTGEVYNFDDYVRDKKIYPIPASPDAIYTGNKDIYFVEFKNQRASDICTQQMQRKFESGTEILKSLLENFTARDCRYHFCVVMKNQAKPPFMDYRHIEKSVVKFGLEELNAQMGGFYDNVVTENLDFYTQKFKDLRCS